MYTRRSAVAVLLGVVLGAALSPGAAQAHADLIDTTPANGARLVAAPTVILLRFTEPVVPAADGVLLLDSTGARRGSEPARTAGSGHEIALPVPADLADGVYTVSWRVVSADSHPVHGVFVFAVGSAEFTTLPDGQAQAGGDRAVGVAFWLFRVLGYLGLALLAGGVVFLLVCWPRGWSRPRVRRILLWAWVTSIVSAVAVLVLQGPYATGGTLADIGRLEATLATDYGAYMLARIGLLAAGAVLIYEQARRPASRALAPVTLAVVAVALPATWTGTGHAHGYRGLAPIAADTVHLMAMSAWIGGLVLLATCVLPHAASRPVREVTRALTRFSWIATASVGLLVVTGLYQAWRGLGSIALLPGSRYGTLLMFKLALLAVLLWFGAMARSVVRRRYLVPALPEPDRSNRSQRRAARADAQDELRTRRLLHRFVRAEAALVLVVLAVTSVLVATPPGRRPAAVPARLASTPAFSAVLRLDGGGQAHIEVDPARVGSSRLAVRVRDAGGRDWDVAEVTGALTLPERKLGPLRLTLARVGPGVYASEALTLPAAGTWQLRVSIRTSEVDATSVSTEFLVT